VTENLSAQGSDQAKNSQQTSALGALGGLSDASCYEKQVALVESACDCAAKHYDDYYKSFAALDGKAQYTATISGFVLASIAGFINAGRLHPLLSTGGRAYGYALVIAPPTLALLSVVLSLVATKVQDVAIPFDSLEQIREAEHLAKLNAKYSHSRMCLIITAHACGTGKKPLKISPRP
jgi:hypothetical protein